jgi:hypothetical protein
LRSFSLIFARQKMASFVSSRRLFSVFMESDGNFMRVLFTSAVVGNQSMLLG